MTALETWIKENVKEGSDINKAVDLMKDLDPLKNIQTKEQAFAFIQRNSLFNSAFDAEVNSRVRNHDDRFRDSELPGILKEEREKTIKELNPKETEDQKSNRELRERLDAMETKEKNQILKESLREKAKRIAEEKKVPYDPLRAERLFVYGDKAEDILNEEIDYFKTAIDSELEKKVKGQFTTKTPIYNNGDKGLTQLDMYDLNQIAIHSPEKKAEVLAEIKRRTTQ